MKKLCCGISGVIGDVLCSHHGSPAALLAESTFPMLPSGSQVPGI
jgi:hypothetical protein